MMYKVRVECDSVSGRGHRLTTLVWTYPREVLAEARTHRLLSATSEALFSDKTLTAQLSMNSASSRAIPVEKMLAAVLEDPWIPPFWGKAQKGMQADLCLEGEAKAEADRICLDMLRYCAAGARRLLALGIHKQHANRYLEPWAWVTQVVTGTDDGWANFFALRTHHAAAPPIRHLARLAYLAYARSRPTPLEPGDWHLPFVRPADVEALSRETLVPGAYSALLVRLSVARCGWVSTLRHEKEASLCEAEDFHDRMMGDFPVHACYDSETEVLTGSGWKRWPDVDGSETFATLAPDGAIEYQTASRVVREQHDGPMYQVRSARVNLLVTPGHNMYAGRRVKGGYRPTGLVPVEDFTTASHRVRVAGGSWVGDGYLPDSQAKLLGFFIGDGSCHGDGGINFHLRKRRKIEYLRSVVAACGFGFSVGADDTYRVIKVPKDFRHLVECCYNAAREKVIPRIVLGMTSGTLLDLLDGLINSDGHVSKTGKTCYDTTSPTLAGQFQELVLKCGACVSCKRGHEYVNCWGTIGKPVFRLTVFRGARTFTRIGWTKAERDRQVRVVNYSGTVYCVTVPNGVVYVRRNGKTLWCGNSPGEHQATPMTAREEREHPEWRSNLAGWLQYRRTVPREFIREFHPDSDTLASWGLEDAFREAHEPRES